LLALARSSSSPISSSHPFAGLILAPAPPSSHATIPAFTRQSTDSPGRADSNRDLPSPRRRPPATSFGSPSTPTFSVEDNAGVFPGPGMGDGGYPHSAEPSSHHHHHPTTHSDGDANYFSSEKYPPTGNGNASSARIPLLADDGSRGGSMEFERTPQRGAGTSLNTLFPLSSRARLHPIMLLPSLIVGMLIAMSGVLGPTISGASSIGSYLVSLSTAASSPVP
jgi:hypothetical protein